VCFNPEEKERDRQTREQAVVRLKEKREKKQLIGNSAYRRYLKLDGTLVSIDERACGKRPGAMASKIGRASCRERV